MVSVDGAVELDGAAGCRLVDLQGSSRHRVPGLAPACAKFLELPQSRTCWTAGRGVPLRGALVRARLRGRFWHVAQPLGVGRFALAQSLVCSLNAPELLCCFCTLLRSSRKVPVRAPLLGQFAIHALDFLSSRVTWDAQNDVRVV